MNKREEGQKGEDLAITTLKKKGYKIVERNHRNRFGEIDIIAEEGGCLVFVEVKKRNSARFGESLWSVDKRKQEHLVKSAQFYMKVQKCFDRRVRFDVVGIDSDRIKVVKNAFMVGDDGR